MGTEKEWPFCVELMCSTEAGVELRGSTLMFNTKNIEKVLITAFMSSILDFLKKEETGVN